MSVAKIQDNPAIVMANRERDRELLIPVDDSGDKDDGSSSKPSSSSAHHSIHERDLVSSHFDSGRPTHEEDVEDVWA
ncbi:hypothetical protein ISN44_As06g019790 [Arabidopsis suecica]|uniref:Uncharacterized protein n=1 Tax=Arabidopsis suecica TaxID=45249 RepID=A0A8T2CHG2_ARASU|nr:hypothetical protein ISN44_As06g019790 [Arabidopsis suecica]